MDFEEILRIRRSLILKKLDGSIREEDYNSRLYSLGELLFKNGLFYNALEIFRELGKREMIGKVAEESFRTNNLVDACAAFEYLGDFGKIPVIIKRASELKDEVAVHYGLGFFRIKANVSKRLISEFGNWALEKGFPGAVSFPTGECLNLAYNLAHRYDLGIGIAKGGLFLTYLFNRFGLNTRIVESHRGDYGASFKCIDEITEIDIKEKNVAIFDKDVVSGKTTERVAEEINKYNPRTLDLILVHDSVKDRGFGTRAENIPKSFRRFYSPKMFDYCEFDKAVDKLEEVLSKDEKEKKY